MENSAFKRGTIAAGLWLKISKSVRSANADCIAWAKRNGLPAFVGCLPVPLACIAVLSVAVVCGFIISSILILFGMFVYMLSNLTVSNADHSESSDDTDEPSGYQYRDGNDGFGMYSGPQNVTVTSSRIDRDEDDDD